MLIRVFKRLFVIGILTLLASTLFAEELSQGLSYKKITTSEWQTVHVLEVNPKHLIITAAHSHEPVAGMDTVANIAKHYHAIAAINGHFFKSDEHTKGLPTGILKIKGKWYGTDDASKGAVGWSNRSKPVFMDRIQTKTSLTINHKKFLVQAVNQPVFKNYPILYTDTFGSSVRTQPNQTNITIEKDKITHIQKNGISHIPAKGYVYSVSSTAFDERVIKIGDTVNVKIEVIPHQKKNTQSDWQAVDNIIGGTPLLLGKGKVLHDQAFNWLKSPFIKNRYARTSVGLLKNGNWVFVVVDQSVLTGSPGMNVPELARFMHTLGCEYALNLDGGGSSTLYLDNTVMNHPELDPESNLSLSQYRRVSDAILILPRKNKAK